MNNITNKQLVLDFYKKVVGGRNADLIDKYVSDSYIQHSPSIKDGKEGLREAIEYLKLLPKAQEQESPIVLVIAEGEYVMLLLELSFMGKCLSVTDLFKVVDGMVVEHWDAMEDITVKGLGSVSFEVGEGFSMGDVAKIKRFIAAIHDRSDVKVHRMIIDGGIVGVQSEGKKSESSFVFYDFLKLENSEMINVWTVEQQIPDKLNHTNGML